MRSLDHVPPPNPGRSCPLHYGYAARSLDRPPEIEARILYVVGGLYGNPHALTTIEAMARREQERHGEPVTLVFNGDFNWFNRDPAQLASINERVLRHRATAGNVEMEMAAPDPSAGCGCAYPEWVDDDDVARSNRIITHLREALSGVPGLRERLSLLPRNAIARVGDCRVAIVHGDAESLAGWTFSRQRLAEPDNRARVERWFDEAGVQVFASSHTCEPLLHALGQGRPRGVIANNGAAGIPNFRDDRRGVITRIGLTPCSLPERLDGLRIDAVHVEALAVPYDADAWWSTFSTQWSRNSPAHVSYARRIREGTRLPLSALRAGPGQPSS